MIFKRTRYPRHSWVQSVIAQPAFYKTSFHSLSNSFSWWQWNKRICKNKQTPLAPPHPVAFGSYLENKNVFFTESPEPAPVQPVKMLNEEV